MQRPTLFPCLRTQQAPGKLTAPLDSLHFTSNVPPRWFDSYGVNRSGKLATNKATSYPVILTWAIRVPTKRTNNGSRAGWFLNRRGTCWPQGQRKTNSKMLNLKCESSFSILSPKGPFLVCTSS